MPRTPAGGDLVVAIWEIATRHTLSEDARERFCARAEFDELAQHADVVLRPAARLARQRNPEGHLLLVWSG